MSATRAFLLVMQREIIERSRTRSYILSTVVIVVLAVGGVAAARFVPAFFEQDPRAVGVVEGAIDHEALERAGDRAGLELEVRAFAGRAAGENALAGEAIEALVDAGEVVFREEADAAITAAVAQALSEQTLEARLAERGLTVEEAAELLAPPPVAVTLLEPADPVDPAESDAESANVAVAFLGAIALFIVILSVGNTVLMGIVEEKTSRVVEVILGAMRPGSLLAGKVVGIASLGVLQLLIGAVAAAIALILIAPPEVSLADVPLETLPVTLAYLVLGVAFYTFAYAAIGATVSRQEEASNASTPITVVLVAVYIFAVNVTIRDADAPLARIAAIVPPLSPIAMPPRAAITDVPAWEIALSLALMLLATLAIIRAGERIYRASVLRVGPRIPLLEAIRSRGDDPT